MIFSFGKRYVYMALAASIAAGLVYSHWFVYRAGLQADALKDLKVIEEHQSHVAELTEELTLEKQKIKVRYRDRIRVVKEAQDPTGCADISPPSDILLQLRSENN